MKHLEWKVHFKISLGKWRHFIFFEQEPFTPKVVLVELMLCFLHQTHGEFQYLQEQFHILMIALAALLQLARLINLFNDLALLVVARLPVLPLTEL